ncbi:RNA recognition motif domain-containing protein [Limisalsivibrio acetivorans]|uniref:RNA recognition motif domain-containing protein n=1 Tax=Limisalsivibrio acetivorans TaxID=1304888 RepID=UPI0003B4C588|nr:RNA-binding protein [Limisalsivibrio acetivorans]
MKNIFVGNLPFNSTEDELRDLFGGYGEVISVKIINDRETGRSRGFGFVEMEDADAEKAMEALNERDFGGRTLRVNEAHSKGGAGRPRY